MLSLQIMLLPILIKQLEFQNVRAGVAVKVNISQEHPLNESAYSSLRSTLVSHFKTTSLF